MACNGVYPPEEIHLSNVSAAGFPLPEPTVVLRCGIKTSGLECVGVTELK